MTRDITFSFYTSKTDTKTQLITKPWTDWIPLLTTHEVRGDSTHTDSESQLDYFKNGPAIILGAVAGTRRKTHVRIINALSLDLDHSTQDEVCNILEKLSKFEYVVYTTHRHNSNVAGPTPRLRVVLPLSSPLPPKKYPAAWEALNTLIGHANDPATKDASRLNFLPSTFDKSKALSDHHEGEWLDVDTHLLKLDNSLDILMEENEQEQQFSSLIDTLNKIKKTHTLKPAALALARGEPFAQAPDRHSTILKLTIYIAQKLPKLNDQLVKRLFEPSIVAMGGELDPPTMAEVLTAFNGAVEKVQESKLPEKNTYSLQELEKIAAVQGCTVAELDNRWIVQKDGGGWVLSNTGAYIGYYSYRDFSIAIRMYLDRAPIQLFEPTQNGFKRRSIEDLLVEYGNVAQHIVSDMTKQKTTFDPVTHTIFEAVTPLKELVPKYDPQLDAWLKLLFGDSYEKGLDWMSACPDLTKQICAIYFSGTKDSGKTIFALGMAKLWTTGAPADVGLVMSDFNEELIRCPFVLADEELPKKFGNQAITTKLRSMLSTTTRALHRKYMPPAELEGAIRLVLTANNNFLLTTNELHTADDLAAIAQRFLYIDVKKDAAEYLATLSREVTGHWLKRGIAEHALHLAETRTIKNPGNRFIVEGDIAEMHRLLLVGSPWSSLVCEWLVRYLLNPKPFDAENSGLVQRKDGHLYVSNQALVTSWGTYLDKSREAPDTRKIGTALNTIAKGKERIQMRWNGKRIWYKEVDIEHLKHWMLEYNIGDEETILETLGISVDAIETDDTVIPLSRKGKEGIPF